MRKEQTAVRYDDATMARINALLEPMTDTRGPATVSDVLRAATAEGLPVLEKRYGVPAPKRAPGKVARMKPVGRRGGKREEVET